MIHKNLQISQKLVNYGFNLLYPRVQNGVCFKQVFN